MKNKEALLTGLNQFTGEIIWYQPLLYTHFLYSQGVRYLATKGDCFWLLDFIFSNQVLPAIAETSFQKWTVELNGNSAIISIEDEGANTIETFTLTNAVFPLTQYSLWFIGGRLILPTEY